LFNYNLAVQQTIKRLAKKVIRISELVEFFLSKL